MIGNCIFACAHQCGKGVPQYFAARVMGRHFREAVIKTKLANILPNQDESDGAFDVGVACIC